MIDHLEALRSACSASTPAGVNMDGLVSLLLWVIGIGATLVGAKIIFRFRPPVAAPDRQHGDEPRRRARPSSSSSSARRRSGRPWAACATSSFGAGRPRADPAMPAELRPDDEVTDWQYQWQGPDGAESWWPAMPFVHAQIYMLTLFPAFALGLLMAWGFGTGLVSRVIPVVACLGVTWLVVSEWVKHVDSAAAHRLAPRRRPERASCATPGPPGAIDGAGRARRHWPGRAPPEAVGGRGRRAHTRGDGRSRWSGRVASPRRRSSHEAPPRGTLRPAGTGTPRCRCERSRRRRQPRREPPAASGPGTG